MERKSVIYDDGGASYFEHFRLIVLFIALAIWGLLEKFVFTQKQGEVVLASLIGAFCVWLAWTSGGMKRVVYLCLLVAVVLTEVFIR